MSHGTAMSAVAPGRSVRAISPAAAKDFQRYIDEGQGGYIGLHHATLLGDIFDGYKMWQWFSEFMGGIRFDRYIAPLADGTVCVEDQTHPIMRGVPSVFVIPNDEWYTYDRNPRPNVHVLAHVDEASYKPDRKSTRLNSSHANISYAVFCLKKKTTSHAHSLLLLTLHAVKTGTA